RREHRLYRAGSNDRQIRRFLRQPKIHAVQREVLPSLPNLQIQRINHMSEHITTLAQARVAKPAAPVVAGFFDTDGFALVQRVAKAFSSSGLVPTQYQGENGIANCMIALNMAQRMNADPMMVMQNLYMVHNQPAWS